MYQFTAIIHSLIPLTFHPSILSIHPPTHPPTNSCTTHEQKKTATEKKPEEENNKTPTNSIKK
jgi:hypothetical protein